MIDAKEEVLILERVSCIYYPVQFKKDAHKTQIQALIYLESEINAIALAYVSKLGLKVYLTDIGTQKINDSILKIFEIVLVSF